MCEHLTVGKAIVLHVRGTNFMVFCQSWWDWMALFVISVKWQIEPLCDLKFCIRIFLLYWFIAVAREFVCDSEWKIAYVLTRNKVYICMCQITSKSFEPFWARQYLMLKLLWYILFPPFLLRPTIGGYRHRCGSVQLDRLTAASGA